MQGPCHAGEATSAERAEELSQYCKRHLFHHGEMVSTLYRVFYYDCMPMETPVYHPYLKRQVLFSRTPLYTWMHDFINELKQKRKFAIRLGKLATEQAHFTIRPDIIRKLCNESKTFDELTEADFMLSLDQKGVDMKIGLDIASLAYKRLVDQIILISGDSDFVPAAKLARREGIDFVLDPLFNPIKPDLFEHIDGLRTCDGRFNPSNRRL